MPPDKFVNKILILHPMLRQIITLSDKQCSDARAKAIQAWVNSVRLIIKQEVDK